MNFSLKLNWDILLGCWVQHNLWDYRNGYLQSNSWRTTHGFYCFNNKAPPFAGRAWVHIDVPVKWLNHGILGSHHQQLPFTWQKAVTCHQPSLGAQAHWLCRQPAKGCCQVQGNKHLICNRAVVIGFWGPDQWVVSGECDCWLMVPYDTICLQYQPYKVIKEELSANTYEIPIAWLTIGRSFIKFYIELFCRD